MPAADPRDEQLVAMFAAWRDAIDSEPFPTFEAAVLRGEHTTAHQLSNR